MDDFDFDSWALLARTAPDEFELRRRNVVESHITSGNNIRRLRGLQCRIDLERERAHTPLKSCLRLSSLMWDTLIDFNELLNTFPEDGYTFPAAPSHPPKSAEIIHIPTAYRPHE